MNIETARSLVSLWDSMCSAGKTYVRLPSSIPLPALLPHLPKLYADDVQLDANGWSVSTYRMLPVLATAKAVLESADSPPEDEDEDEEAKEAAQSVSELPPTLQKYQHQIESAYAAKRTPRPGFVVWDVVDERTISSSAALNDGSRDGRRRNMLADLATRSVRFVPIASSKHIAAVRDLATNFPHFEAVIDSVVNHLKLQHNTDRAVDFEPILLDGPPGVGKTAFARALATAIEGKLYLRSMAEATAGFLITGSSPQWGGADAGVFVHMLLQEAVDRLPVLLLDEIDKARNGSFPPDQALLGVLEPSTAKTFRDEYVQISFDVSPIPIIATCNRVSTIREELVSRFCYFYIPAPDREQMPAIIRSVDRALRAERPELNERFDPLDQGVMTHLLTSTPRELRRQLLNAYATAMDACNRRPPVVE